MNSDKVKLLTVASIIFTYEIVTTTIVLQNHRKPLFSHLVKSKEKLDSVFYYYNLENYLIFNLK